MGIRCVILELSVSKSVNIGFAFESFDPKGGSLERILKENEKVHTLEAYALS